MTDRKRYRSGMLNTDDAEEFGAIVATREGVEVTARTHGLTLEYANTWENINQGFQRLGARIRGDDEPEEYPPLPPDAEPSMEVH